ncbi:MAG TPA: MASE3 domain-containing protein [Syntrophobacteraceae bacterium]|nr:MASE3 domain-containing protein [Syntrophobacteraceae bacterium]
MTTHSISAKAINPAVGAGLPVALSLAASPYLLFHSLVELFSIVIAFGMFARAWNSRRFFDNNCLLFLGIAYPFVGALDLVHTLAYKGMGVFPRTDTNLPTQRWVAARFTESVSLLPAPLFFRRKIDVSPLLMGHTLACSLLLPGILHWEVFPACFAEGSGLTVFKKASEYGICLIFPASVFLGARHRDRFDEGVFRLVVWSIGLTIASEPAFTFYIHVHGFSNWVGHILKIASFSLLYKAVIETGLARPYDLLFRELKKSEEVLRESPARYRGLFNSMTDGFVYGEILCGADGRPCDCRALEVNPSFEKHTGLKAEEVVGRTLSEVLPDTEPFWIEPCSRAGTGGGLPGPPGPNRLHGHPGPRDRVRYPGGPCRQHREERAGTDRHAGAREAFGRLLFQGIPGGRRDHHPYLVALGGARPRKPAHPRPQGAGRGQFLLRASRGFRGGREP